MLPALTVSWGIRIKKERKKKNSQRNGIRAMIEVEEQGRMKQSRGATSPRQR